MKPHIIKQFISEAPASDSVVATLHNGMRLSQSHSAVLTLQELPVSSLQNKDVMSLPRFGISLVPGFSPQHSMPC